MPLTVFSNVWVYRARGYRLRWILTVGHPYNGYDAYWFVEPTEIEQRAVSAMVDRLLNERNVRS